MPPCGMRRLSTILALFCALGLEAQTPKATFRGSVRDVRGAPVVAANVFVFGTLDGALTDSAGGFEFHAPRRDRYLVVVKGEGFAEIRRLVDDSTAGNIVLLVERGTRTMGAVRVEASRYVAADEPGATLT